MEEEVLAMAEELPLDTADLANQASRLLEEHDLTNVLNQIPADAFNDLFTGMWGGMEWFKPGVFTGMPLSLAWGRWVQAGLVKVDLTVKSLCICLCCGKELVGASRTWR